MTGQPETRGIARSLLGGDGPAPMACCFHDGEPLICTFERRGYEFCCVVCGRWYEWLRPAAKATTPELEARQKELKARFDAGDRGPGVAR